MKNLDHTPPIVVSSICGIPSLHHISHSMYITILACTSDVLVRISAETRPVLTEVLLDFP
jgi:hypothetical protein